jgi:2-C-methyl-D-erythritol 4-phosphate cytidylyltransferase
MQSVWVIVVAAGSGSRFGRPKQYEELAGRPVLDWSVGAARAAAGGPGDGVVVVVPPERAAEPASGADTVVGGGATRSSSVRAGLAAVPGDAEVIVVHDGARPLAGAELFARVVAAVRDGADAAVPAVEVTDALRHRSGGAVDRNGLVAVQTPQAFRASALRRAHAAEPEATDDASLVEAAGGKVVVVEGSPANLKITRPVDIAVAEALLRFGETP